MVMCGEQRLRTELLMQIFHNGPCKAEAIEGARAPADLVKNDQAPGSAVVENVGRLIHLHHECGHTLLEMILGANA